MNNSVKNKASHVRVVARIRPLSSTELVQGAKVVAAKKQVVPESFHASECVEFCGNDRRCFELDTVFDSSCTQEQVYEGSGAKKAVCQEVFNGFNCTILSYGQSGAGKTYTLGSAASPHGSLEDNPQSGTSSVDDRATMDKNAGILPRVCRDLFQQIQEKCNGQADVELSYLEIYNEILRDLLSEDSSNNNNHININHSHHHHDRRMRIHETPGTGEVYVSGLTSRRVHSPHEIGALMEYASSRRTVASTALNAVSSRSHAVCILRIKGVVVSPGGVESTSTTFASKLTIVDLAGSERMKKSGAQGDRQKECININKSLLVLGQVISALAEQDKKNAWKPPYRNSKLTHLLQDSLGGNSRTILLACISPSDSNQEESINTLRYAESARSIKNKAIRNVANLVSPEEAAELQRENHLLKKQVHELQRSLRMQAVKSLPTVPEVMVDEHRQQELQEQVEELQRSLQLLTASEERLRRSIASRRRADEKKPMVPQGVAKVSGSDPWPLRLLKSIQPNVDLFHFLVAIFPLLLCVNPLLSIAQEILSQSCWSAAHGFTVTQDFSIKN